MFGRKKKREEEPTGMQWDTAAENALEQSLQQSPVPAMLRGKVEKELRNAAEKHAKNQNRTMVTPEDLMNGMLAKMPDNMKAKVEAAMQQGPEGIKNLENELKKK